MKLNYVAHTVRNGETIVELCKDEVELETVRWKHALILYVVGADPTIAAVERYISAQWNYIAKPKVFYHNDGYFLVRFNSFKDRGELLYSGPHMLGNKPIIVKTWSPEFDLSKEIMKTIPIWVKFPNLPLNCWGMQSLSRLSSWLSIPLYADECTTQIDRVSYARVLVKMDISQKMPTEVKVEDLNGREFTQKVVYEWVPAYCSKCLIIGHKCQPKGDTLKPKDKFVKPRTEWQQKMMEPRGEQSNDPEEQRAEVVRPMTVEQHEGKEVALFIKTTKVSIIALLEHKIKLNMKTIP
ncbi:hypothetical protein KY284_010509 [Solanum tuberosum]|nr:hypothetical protein KY284_010509 [Solanum tuberosum]